MFLVRANARVRVQRWATSSPGDSRCSRGWNERYRLRAPAEQNEQHALTEQTPVARLPSLANCFISVAPRRVVLRPRQEPLMEPRSRVPGVNNSIAVRNKQER